VHTYYVRPRREGSLSEPERSETPRTLKRVDDPSGPSRVPAKIWLSLALLRKSMPSAQIPLAKTTALYIGPRYLVQSTIGDDHSILSALTTHMAPYVYPPLSPDSNEIRLLTLFPGKFEVETTVGIETVTLTENDWPQYEALSYTWGSLDHPVDICVGTASTTTLGVTQNLAIALPYLRLADRPRRLWIDAICVDQQNLVERSRQVKKMKDIFQRAERVIVWLGPEERNSTLALETLDTLASKIEVNWQTSSMTPASTGSPELHSVSLSDELQYDWVTWNAVYYLLHRPWFERLWIWQEIRLQSHDAILLCGGTTMKWQHFRSAIFCLRAKYKEPNIRGLNDRIDHVANLCDADLYEGLETLITRTKYCQCSDPRDRIYALLGMVDRSEADIVIEPDYGKTVGEVYKDVALEYIKKRRNLEILRSCGLENKILELPKWSPDWAASKNIQHWRTPTWVPNWSIPSPTNSLPLCYATGGTFTEAIHNGGEILEVQGVAVGVVDHVECILPSDAAHTTTEMLETMQRLASSYLKSEPYVAGNSLEDAFLRTLCCNSFDETYLPPCLALPNFVKCKEAFLNLQESQEESERFTPPVLSLYLLCAHEHVLGRSLFTTQEGYIGLGPNASQRGDHVYIILGCDAPLVLRPASKDEWLVVGRSYVHGTEDGRAFLGALPGRYRRVIRFEETSKRWWPAYVDHQTGNILIEDPRLGPLPPGWRAKKHDYDKAWNWYVNEESEKGRNLQQRLPGDPRWKSDALIRRGVDLKNLKLI
jgi:Heterokaryon incompatibility protein (HET)